MAKQIFKTILIGILTGVALFVAPFFLIKLFFFFLLIGAIMRLIWGGKRRRGWGPAYHFAYADKVRNMSDEEYASFKAKMNSNSCNHYGYNHCGGWEKTSAKTNTKNPSGETTEINNNQ